MTQRVANEVDEAALGLDPTLDQIHGGWQCALDKAASRQLRPGNASALKKPRFSDREEQIISLLAGNDPTRVSVAAQTHD